MRKKYGRLSGRVVEELDEREQGTGWTIGKKKSPGFCPMEESLPGAPDEMGFTLEPWFSWLALGMYRNEQNTWAINLISMAVVWT
jgi:hypothetical protein